MKFTREAHSSLTIRHVEKGRIKVGKDVITDNVVLFRGTVRPGWRRDTLSDLTAADFSGLIEERPELIVFGAGWQPALPPRELMFALARAGIGFEMMDTPAACRTFNILLAEDRDVAAVLVVEAAD